MMRAILLPLLVVAGCGGRVSSPPATTPGVFPAPVPAVVDAPPPEPMLATQVTANLGPAFESDAVPIGRFVAHRVSAERFLVASRRVALLVDRDFRPLRRTELAIRGRILGASDDGRSIVTSDGTFDAVGGRPLEPDGGGSFVGADANGERFIRVRATETEMTLVVVDRSWSELARMSLSLDALESVPRPTDPLADDTRQPSLNFDVERPASDAWIEDDVLSVAIEERAVCDFALATRALVGCRAFGTTRSLGRRADGAEARIPIVGSEPHFRVERGEQANLRVVASESGAVLASGVVDADHLAFAGATFAWLEADTVHFATIDGETGSASLADSEAGARRIRFVGDRVLVVDRDHGLTIVGPGDTDARPSIVFEHGTALVSTGRRFAIAHYPRNTVLSAGLASAAGDVVERRDATMQSILSQVRRPPSGRAGVVAALSPPNAPTESLALLDRNGLRVLDSDAHDLVRPIRVMRSSGSDACSTVTFLSDVDVAIHGSAPCVPARIHLPDRTITPLGRAYVDVSFSADGTRAFVMADRRASVLDGHTGATLAVVDASVEHPRAIVASGDGRRGVLMGTEEAIAFELLSPRTADRGEEVRVVSLGAVERDERFVEPENARVVRCEHDSLVIEDPFTDGTIRAPSRVCATHDPSEVGPPRVLGIPGYVAAIRDDHTTFVRLSDGAILDIQVVATFDAIALVLLESDRVRGVWPADTSLVAFHDPVTLDPIPIAAAPDAVPSALAAFFLAP